MKTSRAAVGSALFFVVAPGTVVGLIPWLISRWELSGSTVAQIFGVVLICLGLIPAVHAFVEFTRAGGTPAPIAPPEHLVVSGFNRYVRNPMYVGLLVVVLGQALLFGSVGLVLYAAVMWAVTAVFVHWYEEPTLAGFTARSTRPIARQYRLGGRGSDPGVPTRSDGGSSRGRARGGTGRSCISVSGCRAETRW